MAVISEHDAAALMEIVSDGAAEDGTEPFPSTVLWGLARLIPSDVFVGYEEDDVSDGFRVIEEVDVVGQDGPATAESLIDVFREHGWQDPLRGCAHANETRVLRLSDHRTTRQRRKLEYDALVWQPLSIHDALRVWLPAAGRRVRSIYVERSRKNYSNRDVTLLSSRPHLIRMQMHADFRRRATGRSGLTPRESEVLGWIAHGKQNSEIAQLLFISPHTVRKHIENIFEKLDVRTRTAAVAGFAHPNSHATTIRGDGEAAAAERRRQPDYRSEVCVRTAFAVRNGIAYTVALRTPASMETRRITLFFRAMYIIVCQGLATDVWMRIGSQRFIG